MTSWQSYPRECSCISTCHWHQLLGKLYSMTLALPGSCRFFSTLQEAFQHMDTKHCLRLHQATHDFLNDFWWLATTLAQQLTWMSKIIPQPPMHIGSCDAFGLGMGGVWFPPSNHQLAVLW